MYDFENPIPAASKDSDGGFWRYAKGHKVLVPFRRTGHAFLKVLSDLTRLSDSFSSCIKWINTMSYGGMMGTVDIIEKPIPGFSVKTEDSGSSLAETEKKAFIEALMGYGISLPDIVKSSARMEQHEWECGNSWLHIKGMVVADVLTIQLDVVHYLHAAYRQTKPGKPRIVAICKDWSFAEGKIEWTEVPVSRIGKKFNWRAAKGGKFFETVVHNPIELDDGDWYGSPWIISELNWMFTEYLNGDLRCKVDQSETVSKHGFAFKQEDPDYEFCDECDEGKVVDDDGRTTDLVCGCSKQREHPFDGKMRVLREITTADGQNGKGGRKKKSSIFGFEYEEEAPTKYDMEVNRDTNWFKEGLEQAANKIHKKMGVPRELAYDQQARSGIGTNTLINLYLIANCSTVEPTQHARENYWSHVFNELFGLIGRDDLKRYGIRFNDKVTPLVEALKVANSKENGKKDDNDTQ